MSRLALTLSRYYTPIATLGELRVRDASNHSSVLLGCKTIERPWLENRQNVSCVPEGAYTLRKRRSAVVERTSGGEFESGWEITDVPGRTLIMIHPGNWATDVEGCVAVGDSFDPDMRQAMVYNSRRAFRSLMSVLREEDECLLLISRSELSGSA